MKKSIFQISFHMFKQILTYKCAMNGVYVSLIDPKNTSLLTECNKQFIACKKSCSCCGNITDIYSTNRIGLHEKDCKGSLNYY